MKRYWWVNHKQTVEQEIDGGYLWSPKVEQNGARSQFYDNMRLASPGDFVVSFANGTIGHLGQVSDYAISSGKPAEFGSTGRYWAAEGWLLPVAWKRLRTSLRPKSMIASFRQFLPEKYSPINALTGNGHQKAYLAEIRVELFQFLMNQTGIDLDLVFGTEEAAALFGSFAEILDEAIERQLKISSALSMTEKTELTTARRGQGLFRSNVIAEENCCRITGVTNPHLLIASHIKPWRLCATSHERLDGNNGLLLTPHVDLLFDRGFITFTHDGNFLVSSRLHSDDQFRLGILNATPSAVKSFNDQQKKYLDYHKNNVYLR